MSAPGRLAIDRLTGAYVVARGHPSPDGVRARLDAVLGGRVPDLCGAMLRTAVGEDDRSIWLVRRVDVEMTVDVGETDDDALARAWAAGAAAAIVRRMAAGPDGESVVRFDDEADQVAAFAADLAAGRAWERWYHSGFASLRVLPAGAAILAAMRREPAATARALALLVQRGQLARVASLLSEREAAAMRALVPAGPAARPAGHLLAEAMDAWVAQARTAWGWGAAGVALAVHARLLASSLDTWSSAAGAAAVELLAGLAGSQDGEAGPRLLARAIVEARAGRPGAMLALARRDAGSLLDALGARPTAASFSEAPGEAVAFASRWGAVFLLLPSLVELEVPALARDGELRLLVLLKAMGAGRERGAVDDPALRLAAGCAAPDPERLGRLTARAVPRQLRTSLARQDRLGGRLVLERTAARTALLRDTLRDEWLSLGARGGATRALARIRSATGIAAAVVPEAPAALRPVGGDLDHLSTATALPDLRATADRGATLLAHAALRRFAERLPGFSLSSASYLARNFLTARAWIAAGGDRIDVELAGIPLSLVLRLAGLQGQTCRVPWLGDAEVRITLSEAGT